MSPEAVTRRLQQTSELRDLCIALGGERLKKRMLDELRTWQQIAEKQAGSCDSEATNETNLPDDPPAQSYSARFP